MTTQNRRLSAKAGELYRLYGLVAMIAALGMILLILFTATTNGLSDGNYAVLVVTNRYDENFAELCLMILAIPAVVSEIRRFISTMS